jgi:hypothetical protein
MKMVRLMRLKNNLPCARSGLVSEEAVKNVAMNAEVAARWERAHMRRVLDDSDTEIHNNEIHGVKHEK